jgi:hypothetical protein
MSERNGDHRKRGRQNRPAVPVRFPTQRLVHQRERWFNLMKEVRPQLGHDRVELVRAFDDVSVLDKVVDILQVAAFQSLVFKLCNHLHTTRPAACRSHVYLRAMSRLLIRATKPRHQKTGWRGLSSSKLSSGL